jgi:predicted RNA-binding protein Jag
MEGRPAQSHIGESRPPEFYLASIEAVLNEIIRHGGFELAVEIRQHQPAPGDLESPEYVVDFSGQDSTLLLESNGILLDAFEYVVRKAVRLEDDLLTKITFDCEEWRLLRVRELQLTAQLAAERVLETGDPYPLGPMNPRDRRIVHLALRDQPKVRTQSEGFGRERKVVIYPAAPAPVVRR